MPASLKPLNQQVIVITGASSGIGLATARLAAERGAKLVLIARSAETLKGLAAQIRGSGGEAIHIVARSGRQPQRLNRRSPALRRSFPLRRSTAPSEKPRIRP